jgi:CheY-like chemotaxis protein
MSSTPIRPLEILMVDDNPADFELVRDTFEEQSLPGLLSSVRDGDEALRYLRRAHPYGAAPRPDLILLDLNIPGKDGFEILSQIRVDQELSCIPIVILTSSASEEDIDRSYQLGANAYVVKPVGLDQFSMLVRSVEAFWLGTARLPSKTCRGCA